VDFLGEEVIALVRSGISLERFFSWLLAPIPETIMFLVIIYKNLKVRVVLITIVKFNSSFYKFLKFILPKFQIGVVNP